ncbi:protoporphyrinogen oxidase [Bacillaceae bacterium SIJ1]|uniref:protoporphyrinogen oxidase n=1 Tax=Litoribacterium kuwaitense TaxID=1398745 RepID=UPI0013EB081A|nr:protoporphyrinogen oxidase [Litoribacterium kuwaitense]NGP44469.1 protoporphyrinogen oxidase [Litoribacterium kuwaitense]
MTKNIVVIGGGITGLTAAYRLEQAARESNGQLSYTLLEASPRLGGKIRTLYKDGFIIERGPDSFLERKTSAAELCKEIGLEDELVRNTTGQSYVLIDETLHPIPKGAVMGVPTSFRPFITSKMFTPVGKLRASADIFIPKSNETGDQSVGAFFRRRLGDQVVDHLIEPLLSGIYGGNIDRLSLFATFPQFYEVEQKKRSLILGMKQSRTKPLQKKKGQFLTLKNGLETIVERLAEELTLGDIRTGMAVTDVERNGDRYDVHTEEGVIQADGVIFAAGHRNLSEVIKDEAIVQPIVDMPSASLATVAMAFREEAVEGLKDGTGFVVSKKSDYDITACTWTQKKWPHTTPEGHVLLRAYVGKPGNEGIIEQSDDAIVGIALHDLKKVIQIHEAPLFSVVTRWRQATPQYVVGHKERIEQLKSALNEHYLRFVLAGSSYDGLGLPDCITQANKAAETMLSFVQDKKILS